MSTPSFGQPPAFGAPAPGPVEPPVEAEPEGRGRRTVVIAVAAGVVALGVLGGAAALVLTSGGEDDLQAAVPPDAAPVVEPSATASAVPSPLPTAAVLGRNVFAPLVEAGSGEVSAEAVPVAPAPEPSHSATAVPTTVPTTVPTSLPVLLPAPTVTQVVEVPVAGPTTVVTQPVPGPTVTTGPLRRVDRFAHQVEVLTVEPLLDDAGEPVIKEDGTPDSRATYRVNGTQYEVVEDEVFLSLFRHVDLVPPVEEGDEDAVMFQYGSSVWTVSVGTNIGLGPR